MSVANLAARFGAIKPENTITLDVQGSKVELRRVRSHTEFQEIALEAGKWAENIRALTQDKELRNMIGSLPHQELVSCRMLGMVTIPGEGETVDSMSADYVRLAANAGAVFMQLYTGFARAIGVVDEVVAMAVEGKAPLETTGGEDSPSESAPKPSTVTPTILPETP